MHNVQCIYCQTKPLFGCPDCFLAALADFGTGHAPQPDGPPVPPPGRQPGLHRVPGPEKVSSFCHKTWSQKVSSNQATKTGSERLTANLGFAGRNWMAIRNPPRNSHPVSWIGLGPALQRHMFAFTHQRILGIAPRFIGSY